MMMPQLQKGDKIEVVAPAGRGFLKDLGFAKKWASQQGWELVYTDELLAAYDLGYLYAGEDAHRAAQMQKALDNPETKAIWCLKGGYGSVKIIDKLDFTQFLKHPKWLIGYSDITVFHNYLNNQNVPSLHGIMVEQKKIPYELHCYDLLKKVLHHDFPVYDISPTQWNQTGSAQGKLVGGNLSILYSQLGSSTALQGQDLILFIEDWYEDWYHVDRMMMALGRSGLWKQINGVVVGSFTRMDVEEENPNFNSSFDSMTYKVLNSHLASLNIPVAYGFPAGHIPDNRPLVMGQQVELNVKEESVQLCWK